jgi:hypothetical protein
MKRVLAIHVAVTNMVRDVHHAKGESATR